jgi:hypothetical protein
MAAPDVVTHAIHGQLSASADVATRRGALVSSCGRLVAVGSGEHVHLYDAHDASDFSDVLGAGSCKLRFLCSFPVTDIASAVTVHALHFLKGGHLVLSGACDKGTGASLPLPPTHTRA